MINEYKEKLLIEIEKLHIRKELSKTVSSEYFEPGMMEFLDESEGIYDEANGSIMIRFEAKGTRYGDRTEVIEKLVVGDPIQLIREKENPFNSNNFMLLTKRNQNVGNMPAELCNAIAPLYDCGYLRFTSSTVSFVEPISKRSRYAKQGVVFVELKAEIKTS